MEIRQYNECDRQLCPSRGSSAAEVLTWSVVRGPRRATTCHHPGDTAVFDKKRRNVGHHGSSWVIMGHHGSWVNRILLRSGWRRQVKHRRRICENVCHDLKTLDFEGLDATIPATSLFHCSQLGADWLGGNLNRLTLCNKPLKLCILPLSFLAKAINQILFLTRIPSCSGMLDTLFLYPSRKEQLSQVVSTFPCLFIFTSPWQPTDCTTPLDHK